MIINGSDKDWSAYAAAQGQRILNVPLQDGGTARMLWSPSKLDCFVTDRPIGAKEMFAGGAKCEGEAMTRETVNMLVKLQKVAAEGFDVMSNFIKHCR